MSDWESRTLDRFAESIPPFVTAARFKELVRAKLYRPRYVPSVAYVVMASDCTTWVNIAGSGPDREWIRFDTTGVVLTAVRLPSSERIAAADGRSFVTLATGEYDIPSVVRYVFDSGIQSEGPALPSGQARR